MCAYAIVRGQRRIAFMPENAGNNLDMHSVSESFARDLVRYRDASLVRAAFELGVTVLALFLSWGLMWLSLGVGYWLTLLLAIPTAGFLVRLFMVQHDCGHGSFFRNRFTNDWVGRVLGVLTLTPYDYWKRNHALHHATSANLDRRGTGDILTLTLSEYRARPFWGRVAYRAYRNPIVMFGIGPAYLFFLQHRIPFEQMRLGWRPWTSAIATNAGIAAFVAISMWLIGPWAFLALHLPVVLLSASIGVWLFYVQHQFEDVVWSRNTNWSLQDAALLGSSHYDLPPLFSWFTGNIGIHHVHHLSSRIPFYRLREVMRDHPRLHTIGRVTFGESLRSVRLALWDEAGQKLVSFREAATIASASAF
jgi:omega-6 fatty acid desaturase (delta-12 desaturase)